MKLIVNMIMGSMMATFSEGLLLSEKGGLDPNVLVECHWVPLVHRCIR
uniref:6-phosphogluconate dehydrogenase NADP-binding domain-containing protein n=1 Tax=Populus trichocarpa TaxID=3694 RepID=A0A3N7EM25_POPTR